MNKILNKRDEIEYKRHMSTANLVRDLYRLKCEGKRLTPEKLDALCRLTWWNGDKKSALIKIWGGRKANIPTEKLESVANNNIAIVNYRNSYRNSTLDWIKKNFKQLLFLVDSVVKMKSDNEAFQIACIIEQLPGIPSPNKTAHLDPMNLLTPLFACLDSRRRFPIINGNDNIKKLQQKLGITGSSLPEKVETLIRLIGSYGIKDAFMLDVMSNELSKIVVTKPKQQNATKLKVKQKSLGEKNDSDLIVLFKSRAKKFIRLHNSMTNNLMKICKIYGCEIYEGGDSNKYDALISDYNGKGIDLLIEAKSSILRPHMRLAVGQLFDYRRKLDRRATTDLAILLPEKPDSKSLEYLNDIGIYSIWFTDSSLKRISSNFKTRVSDVI